MLTAISRTNEKEMMLDPQEVEKAHQLDLSLWDKQIMVL